MSQCGFEVSRPDGRENYRIQLWVNSPEEICGDNLARLGDGDAEEPRGRARMARALGRKRGSEGLV
jgi:hypothetical protein